MKVTVSSAKGKKKKKKSYKFACPLGAREINPWYNVYVIHIN